MNVLPFGDAVRHCSFHLFRFSAKGAAHARSFPPWSLSAVSLVTGLGLLSSTTSNSSLQTSYVGKTMNSMKPENEKKKTLTAYSAWLGIFLWRNQRTNQHPKGTVKPHIPFFKQMCRPCLIIIKSCYCDYRINQFSHVLAAWSAFRALFTWSWCTACAKDHGGFL